MPFFPFFKGCSFIVSLVISVSAGLFSSVLLAETSELIKDINQSVGTLNPNINGAELNIQIIHHNGITYFSGNDAGNGKELWRTDGTASGTYMIKDISPGAASSDPANFAILNDEVYFSAENEAYGRELWKTDGTEAGTMLVVDINPGASPSLPMYLTNFNGLLLFRAYTTELGHELWRSDGTAEGTWLVKDLRPNTSDSNPSSFTVYNNELYFNALATLPGSTYDSYSLWKSDGTAEGTVSIKELFPSVEKLLKDDSLELNGILYFSSGGGLWQTNGTEEGTSLIKTVSPSGSRRLRDFFTVEGIIYFVGDDEVHGEELWRSDGTEAGTWMVKDIRTGSNMSFPTNFLVFNNIVYFQAMSDQYGYELWKSDGTEQGTQLVIDAVPGSGSSDAVPMVLGNQLFFQAKDVNGKAWFWETDGTPAGSQVVTALSVGTNEHYGFVGYPHRFVINDRLYFTVYYLNGVSALWSTNGTADGTSTLLLPATASGFEIHPGLSYPANFTQIGNDIFFTANDGEYGTELWKTDGTFAGTYMVKDIAPGSASSRPKQLVVMGGVLYFFAIEATSGAYYELWRSDGTENGTYMVKDIWPGDIGSFPEYLTVYNNKLYFQASESSSSRDQLWQSDGTESGTVSLNSLIIMPEIIRPWHMTVLNDTLFFSASGVAGYELYKFDGSNVQMVKDIANVSNGADSSYPSQLTIANNVLFFKVKLGENGHQLWRTDGSEQGTYFLKVINPEYDTWSWISNYDGQFTPVGNGLYFVTQDDNGVRELWTSDGTTTGTRQLAIFDGDTNPLTIISDLTAVGDTLYFRGYSFEHGYELWRSDGTPEGTGMVKDIVPGLESSGIASLADINGVLYFAASNELGNEVWTSDGTEQGTLMLTDVNPGLSSSNPKDFLKIEQGILHTAFTTQEGQELRLLVADPSPIPPPLNQAPQFSANDDGKSGSGSMGLLMLVFVLIYMLRGLKGAVNKLGQMKLSTYSDLSLDMAVKRLHRAVSVGFKTH